jgi:hypothetical protein
MTGIVDLFAADGSFITKGHKRQHVAAGRDALLKLYGGITAGEITPASLHSQSRDRIEG